MRVSTAALLGLMPAGILSQDVFEPADFNVTEALLDNGVNVSAIPDLAGLAERSLLSGCSIAVRRYHPQQRTLFLCLQWPGTDFTCSAIHSNLFLATRQLRPKANPHMTLLSITSGQRNSKRPSRTASSNQRKQRMSLPLS